MNAKELAASRKKLIEQFGQKLAEGALPKEYLKAAAPLVKYAKMHESRLTASIIGDWIAANPTWKPPKKEQPKKVVPAEPVSDHGVFQDTERRTCIRLSVDPKGVTYIPMETELDVQKASHMEFEKRYTTHLKDYPVKQAAAMYLGAAWLSITEEARRHLEHLNGSKFKDVVKPTNFEEKESIMATAQTAGKKKPATKPAAKQAPAKASKVAAPKVEKAPAKAAKVAAPKKEAAAKKPAGPDTRKIKVLSPENPKRGGAAERFALYKSGMSVDKYVEAGGKREDIAWDVKKGFISVD